MSYLCRNGHLRRTPEQAADCSVCKANERRRTALRLKPHEHDALASAPKRPQATYVEAKS